MHRTSQHEMSGLDLSPGFKRIAGSERRVASGGDGDRQEKKEKETVEILYKCVYPGRKGEKIWQFLPLPDLQQYESAEETWND